MRKVVTYFLVAAVCIAGLFLLVMSRGPDVVPVALFFEETDLSSSVVSRQSLQAVVLAMEFFNSRSSSHVFAPIPFSGIDMETSMQLAARQSAVAVIGGINTSFASLLADAARRANLPTICLAPGDYLARSDDLIFRSRPDSGGKALGRAARRLGTGSYVAIVSGFNIRYVQDFIRDFESEAGMPPKRTMIFSGNLNKQIEDFERVSRGMDAALLVLPDWLASIAAREIRRRVPHLALFASNWAVSHRTPLLAGTVGEGLITASNTHPNWDSNENEFIRFVEDTYGRRLTRITLSIGYDTVAMLDAAVRDAGSADQQAIVDSLRKLQGVATVGGTVSVDENGDMKQAASLFTLSGRRWMRSADHAEVRP